MNEIDVKNLKTQMLKDIEAELGDYIKPDAPSPAEREALFRAEYEALLKKHRVDILIITDKCSQRSTLTGAFYTNVKAPEGSFLPYVVHEFEL